MAPEQEFARLRRRVILLRFLVFFHVYTLIISHAIAMSAGGESLGLLLLAVGSLSSGLVDPMAGAFADRQGPLRPIAAGCLFSAIALLVLGAVYPASSMGDGSPLAVIIAQLFFGVGMALCNSSDKLAYSLVGGVATDALGTATKYGALAGAGALGAMAYVYFSASKDRDVLLSSAGRYILWAGALIQMAAFWYATRLRREFCKHFASEKQPFRLGSLVLAARDAWSRQVEFLRNPSSECLQWIVLYGLFESFVRFSTFLLSLKLIQRLMARCQDAGGEGEPITAVVMAAGCSLMLNGATSAAAFWNHKRPPRPVNVVLFAVQAQVWIFLIVAVFALACGSPDNIAIVSFVAIVVISALRGRVTPTMTGQINRLSQASGGFAVNFGMANAVLGVSHVLCAMLHGMVSPLLGVSDQPGKALLGLIIMIAVFLLPLMYINGGSKGGQS